MTARLLAQLEGENAFLRGVIEQLQRDGAEVRAALRKALELAPKQLAAGESSTINQTARNAPQGQLPDLLESYDGAALNGPQKGSESLSYGDIADALEALEKERSE